MASGLLGLLGASVAHHVPAAYGHTHAPVLNLCPLMMVHHVRGSIQIRVFTGAQGGFNYILFIYIAVDGQWATWSSWSKCSTSCDNGTWSRTRTCTEPAPMNGGKPCTGNHTDTGTCNLRSCPGKSFSHPILHRNSLCKSV